MRLLLPALLLIFGCGRVSRDGSAAVGLRTLLAAQEDLKTNDRCGDGKKAYWVRDIAGLYGHAPGGAPLKLIDVSLARADTTGGRTSYASVPEPAPYVEAYWVAVLMSYRENGKSVPYDDGTGRHPTRFGVVAYPARYPRTGRLTLLLNETGRIYAKDLQGQAVQEYPDDPVKAGWQIYDSSR